MHAAGMACDFVGHPIATVTQASATQAKTFRQAMAPNADPLVLVLPGSRRGEVSRLGPIFGETLAKLNASHPNMRAVVPAAPSVASLVKDTVKDWPGDPIVLDSRGKPDEAAKAEKLAAFKSADVALAASGTVSLELAAAQTPMVIAYDMNWISRLIISRMLKTDTVTLVNLVSETRVVPEFIGAECDPDKIARGLADVLQNPGAQGQARALTMERLGQGGEAPGLRAARAILDRLPA
jgi:lipid-A-disaccharide synthase